MDPYPPLGLFICSSKEKLRKWPSQHIASNYNPSIKSIRLHEIPNKIRRTKSTVVTKCKSSKEIVKSDGLSPGLCYLKDLLNRPPVVKKKIKKSYLGPVAKKQKEENYAYRSAPLPEWPEVQLARQRQNAKVQLEATVNEKDAITITYYISKGIDSRNIELLPKKFINNSCKKVEKKLTKNKRLQSLLQDLKSEVTADYELNARMAILDYVLLDPKERHRLGINTFPKPFPKFIIQAPVPWHTNFLISRQYCRHNLFTSHIIMRRLHQIWCQEFSNLLFVSTEMIDKNVEYPLTPAQLEQQVDQLCGKARQILTKEWLPICADVLMDLRDHWQDLRPTRRGESLARIERFFGCVGALMSRHLRLLVFRSLRHFLLYFQRYKEGNDFGEEFVDFKLVKRPLIVLKVMPSIGSKDITFSPTLEELTNLVYRCFIKIIDVNRNLPRLEAIMFPDMKDSGLCLSPVSQEEEEVLTIINQGLEYFSTNVIGPQKYLRVYDKFLPILSGKEKNGLLNYIASSPPPSLLDFSKRIETYDAMQVEIGFLRKHVPLNFISLDCCKINEMLWQEVFTLRTCIVEHHIILSHTHNRQICNEFDEMSNRASELPDDTATLVALTKYLTHCQEVRMFELRKMIRVSANNLLFLVSHSIFPTEHIQLNARVFLWPRDMESVFEISSARLSHRREIVEGVLRDKKSQFEQSLSLHERQLLEVQKKDPPILTMEEMKDSVASVKALSDILQVDKKEAEAINEEESLLNWLPTPFTELYNMLVTIEPFEKLWNTVLQFHLSYDLWYYGPFAGLDAAQVQREVEEMLSVLIIVAKQLAKFPGAKRIGELVKVKLEQFRALLPLLHCICNPGLCERHWQQISEIIGFTLDPTEHSTLAQMVSLGLVSFVSQFEEISACASKEFALEQKLKAMMAEWKDVQFECIPYRESGVCTLAAVDDIQLMLDDHILKAQTMHSSPYVKAFENEMQKWEDKLISMQDILDTWLTCQATWLYLEPIFSSEDIMRQMPREGQKFVRVDKAWRDIMANTQADPHVLAATDMLNMLSTLRECNSLLEEIQKGLNEYLEKKRLFFPRFFFLSNDELLEILSETKDARRVQPQLKKCFEGINRLEFNVEQEVVGMISTADEVVPFSGKIVPADAKGMVERWLAQLEDLMVRSVRDMCREAVAAYQRQPRTRWILQWPGQAVACASSIHWTTEVANAIRNSDLKSYLEKSEKQLQEIMELVRSELTANIRFTIENLIVADIHACDVSRQLVAAEVNSLQDFLWLCQMRQYWREDSVIVSMVSTDVIYGFEYLGNTTRLAMTPLTDRCFRTMMAALRLNMGAALEGPCGAGKSETCKDLAKAVAKQCVVFNCSEDLDYKSMAKFFKGLAQSGAWACFDEFDLIRSEVLSVVAQQIFTIRTAIRTQQAKFTFDGTEIALDPTCAIFVTLNQSHTRNQRLPENLKALFRPVAMTQPDCKLISEMLLFSAGFLHAKSLACKIDTTFTLCSRLLSPQPHYDFSMRAVKCVLTSCRKMKLQNESSDDSFDAEAQLVLQTIIDAHISKFTVQDTQLFQGILHDCFPDTKSTERNKDELEVAVRHEMEVRGLQCTPWYFSKVMQLYEVLQVHHGIMLVGSSLGGKTSAYQVLAAALTEVANNAENKLKEHKVVYKVINPKAITSGQLYGCFDSITYEWSDGILANTFREYASSSTLDRKWIVFDGPVDSSWVENMNTTLDDNKKLCLMSGEIIKMAPCMTLIFECSDLARASPSVVSRCGVVLLDSRELGWQALADAFNAGPLRSRLSMDEQLELVGELMTWLVKPVLEYVAQLPTFLHTSHMHRFRCFSRLFLCLLGNDTHFPSLWLQGTLIFSLIWGTGSTLTAEGKKMFDLFFRSVLSGENKVYPRPKVFKLTPQQLIPEKGTVFDWVHDKKNNGTWVPWMDTLDKSQLQTLVPTPELACQQFFLRTCLAQEGTPMLMIGPAGSGKSAVILDYMKALPKEKYLANVINFSARTSANHTQDMIMARLDRRRKGVFGPPMGKQCVLFVDDVSVPHPETYGAQPAVELLRQWMDHGHWYDRDTTRLELVDILFVTAMAAGSGQQLSPRFIRHMHVVAIDTICDASIEKIFTTQLIEWHFSKGFNSNITRLGKSIVQASLEVYRGVLSNFLPTPERAHYVFCTRDLTLLIQGLTAIPAAILTDSNKLMRLWIHETYRIFHDRLCDLESRNEFFNLIKHTCTKYFNKPIDSILRRLLREGETKLEDSHVQRLIFGSFMEPDANPRIYDEIADEGALMTKLEFYLHEHNASSRSPLPLVLFEYAMQHACRISRVLHLPEAGHALLVGVAGTGRRSVARMAATMAGQAIFEIEVTKNYGFDNWRNDLKILLKRSGAENKPTMFLLSDTQLINDLFLEDLNLILCTGDIPTLFSIEEKTDILEKMQTIAKDMGKKIEASPLALYSYFIERIRANLHVILALSPIGRDFRDRFYRFPSLLSCCLINWFTTWPEKDLEKVADYFLSKMELEEDVRFKCIAVCKYFHTSSTEMSLRFKREMKRYNYITPASYLELIHTFEKLFISKTEAIQAYKNRYIMGLQKLDFAANQVEVMQEQLKMLRPQLMDTSEETDKLMIKIEQDTVEVEAKKEIVGSDEAKANEAAAAAQAIKDDCEGDLAEAIPALESAVNALNTLKPADITVVKAMKNPPPGVKLVMEAICVMKGIKPDRKPDPSGSGKMLEDFWGPSLKLLGDIKFLDSLKSYNKDNISPTIMKRIRDRYIHDREFHPESVRKTSTACEGLCKWVRAIEVYDRVIKIVAPKKAKLAEAEAELAIQMGTLNEKREQLQQVTDKLQTLNDDFAAMSKKKKDLEDNIDLCSQKLERAEKLIGGLGGEKNRWVDMASQLENKLSNVTGDILLASGMVTYLGAFNADFRQECVQDWIEKCKELQIPCTEQFSLLAALGDAMEMRNWNIAGLPDDPFSLESGIIVKNCRRCPLMIDPQGQASRWIKNLESSNNLVITKLTNRDYIIAVEKAIENGYPLLIENIGEELDPILDPILLNKTYTDGEGKMKIKFGDFVLNYNENFQLYLTTTLSNPHYLPDTAVKVTLLNFMLRPAGLEERLLALVVSREQPHLEDSKGALILEGARNRKELQDIEDRILEVLSSTETNILEDETGIEILSTSKALSEEISSKQKISSEREKEIDIARFQYMSVARYASVLFFCIAELHILQPTYEYSLTWYTALYIQAIDKSEPSKNIEEKIKILNKNITHIIYENICRSLFERDKIVFSFLLWIAILRSKDNLDEEIWKFILGNINLQDNYNIENPDPSWITDVTWQQIITASTLSKFTGLEQAVTCNTQVWKEFAQSKNPHKMQIPLPFENLSGLHKIAILKCFRPDRFLHATYEAIGNELGNTYVEPPVFDLQKSFNVSSACVPLILVISPGTDPTEMILQFALDCGMNTPQIISLGQGQESAAENTIIEGACKGNWVILQNCHLFESWMPELERICDITTEDKTHKNFRLWLITNPSNSIPVSILEKGVKMTTETPQNFKSKVKHCYKIISSCKEKSVAQIKIDKLTFSISLFHAVVLGRKLFDSLGWNMQYEFNDDDYKMSIAQIQVFLDECKDQVPYNGLNYMIAKCFYGGRISDENDRKLLESLLNMYCSGDIAEKESYKIADIFDIPEPKNLDAYLSALPLENTTEIYGLNENASIFKGLRDTEKMLSSVMLVQPPAIPSTEPIHTISVATIITELVEQIPRSFDISFAQKVRYIHEDCKNIALHQELTMYNELLATLHSSLKELSNALEGHAVMTKTLEVMRYYLSINEIPPQWKNKSYPTLKHLKDYIQDLRERIQFFENWINNGIPRSYWISAFFCPKNLLTLLIQNYSRQSKIPVEELELKYLITEHQVSTSDQPDVQLSSSQIMIHGLSLEGARWDKVECVLSVSGTLHDLLPAILVEPVKKVAAKENNSYLCPLYQTCTRGDALLVTHIPLPTNQSSKTWLHQGVACLCQTE